MSDEKEPGEPGDAGGAPDPSTQGVDSDVQRDPGSDTVTTTQESPLGPGAGESPLVKVTAPVQREGDEVTTHPTLRDNRIDDGDEGAGDSV